LLATVGEQLYETYLSTKVYLPYQQGGLISLFHENGQVEWLEYVQGGVLIKGKLPGRLVARFKSYTRIPNSVIKPADPNPDQAIL